MMELVYMERRNGYDDESTTPEFSGSLRDDEHLPVAASELRSDLGQAGGKQPFSSVEKKSAINGGLPHSDDYPTFPSKKMILNLLIRSLRHPRRTHDVGDPDDMVSEGSSIESLALSSMEKMVHESICEFAYARTKLKNPSFFLPGAKTRKMRSRSHIRTQAEILKLISPMMCDALSSAASPPKKRTSEFSMHENMSQTCSRTTSISSIQSASSPYRSLTVGLLHCIWKDGLPHYEFSLDDPVGVYKANLLKVSSDNDNALDFVYLFHSGGHVRKDWIRNSSNASRFVGKMKVSSSLILNSDSSSLMETEFVLSGSCDDYLKQMQSSSSVPKSKGLAKRVAEMVRPDNFSSSPKHGRRFGRTWSQQFDDLSEMLQEEFSSAKESSLTNLITDDLPTSHELAAILVRQHWHEHQKELVAGGWGLKFLEKAGASQNVQNRKKPACRHINVVVPRSYHGGAVVQDGGPSSLIERWKFGGRCDCGGWDLGCPIRVLNNGYCSSLLQAEPQDCRSVDLFVEGAEINGPVLRLVNITEDLHILYFDWSLSTLQALSAGVAIAHSQTPHLYLSFR